MDATTRLPLRLSTLFTFMIGPPLQGEAGSLSGAAWTNAPKVISCSRIEDRVRIPTAAGNSGLTMVPLGRMQRQTRVTPEFKKIGRVQRVEDVDQADQHHDVALFAAGWNVH